MHYTASISFLEKAIEKYPAYPGPHHLYIARAYADLGQAEGELLRYTVAEKHLQQAVSVGQQYMSPDDPGMAAVWTRLGELYRNQHKYSLAEPLLRRAYELARHPATAEDIKQEREVAGNLADLYPYQLESSNVPIVICRRQRMGWADLVD